MSTPRVPLSVLLLAAGLAACSSGGGPGGGTPPTSPGGPALTLAAAPADISVQGTSVLTARAAENGAPVAGATVSFTTTLGRLDAAAVGTDADGVALTRLRGDGASGTATVTARLGTGSASATAQVRVGLGRSLTLGAVPEVIASDGAATLTAVAREGDGAPVPAGTVVELVTTLGRLTDPRPRADALGVATSELRGDGASGTATVTATVSGAAEPARVSIAVGGGRLVDLAAQPARIAVDGSAVVRATVREFGGGGPAAGVAVALTTTLGRLDDPAPRTDASGLATTTLRGDGRAGTATLTATVDGGAGPATFEVVVGGGASLRLVVNPARIPATGSSTVTIVASAADGSPAAGVSLELTTDLGRLDADRLTTDGTGTASTVLRPQGRVGTATLTAAIAGQAPSAAAQVEVVAP